MNTPAPVTLTDQPLAAAKKPIVFGSSGVQLASFEDAYRFAIAVVKSGWAPKGMDSPEAVLIAIQHGAELGLPPMAALQNIAVINGRPGIYGDAALALVRSKDLIEQHVEEIVGTEGKDDWGCKVTTKRKGSAVAVETFTVADAKRASLWGKAGPWSQYPKRMLRFRARGFSLRDNYGDVLKGLRTVEELQDMPAEPRNVTPVRKGLAEALDTTPTTTAEAAPVFTDEQRTAFLDLLENYILDANVTEKALVAELRAAGVAIDDGFALAEQPSAVLDHAAKYVTAKAGTVTPKKEGA